MVNNKLLNVSSLKQSYYALRHGQSMANVGKIISSDPAISTVEHGLSEVGVEQAKAAGTSFTSTFCPDTYAGIAVFSSDFLRARETAGHMADAIRKADIPLYQDKVVLETSLRERFFGTFNGQSDAHYHDVWKFDADDASHTEFEVESVNSVIQRTTDLILQVDEKLSGGGDNKPWKCVMVAHGDVLQILQTAFLKVDGRIHRSLDHLETATIRELKLSETQKSEL